MTHEKDGEVGREATAAHARTPDDVARDLKVEPAIGLSGSEAAGRLAQHGANVLRTRKPVGLIAILANQLRSPVVLLLVGAAVLALVLGEVVDAIAIGVVLLINTAIGFATELRAVRSMEALRRLVTRSVRVRRDGAPTVIPARDLVPGDVVLLEAGNVLPADMRILESANLGSDESILTGESLPVDKSADAVPDDAPLAERTSMVFSGAALSRGTGEAVVTATGMETELGRIAGLVDESTSDRSPLDRRLERLGRDLIWMTLAVAAAVAVAGIMAGGDLTLMIETAIALAVAAIPEGLPIVATLALARGMVRMARRNALIRNLSAVETLGATTVILTDKTGTLTENRMHVARVVTAGGVVRFDHAGRTFVPLDAAREPDAARRELLRVAALCNNATLAADTNPSSGDPMEVALLEVAAAAGIDRPDLVETWPEVTEHAFDETVKMMATVHRTPDGTFLYAVKGAPEAVFAVCSSSMAEDGGTGAFDQTAADGFRQACDDLAADGLRILAFAGKTCPAADVAPYDGLTLLGFVAISDPPRSDAAAAIAAAHRAGIRVVMVTGDHARTARSIAGDIGLAPGSTERTASGADLPRLDRMSADDREAIRATTVFSRVTPEQKLDLVTLHQEAGEIVAMTGDGVNDAPAIKKADIGIAMGGRGTEVAREAADMVLQDDAFPTILHAVREGRVVYTNIRRFTTYLLSCNLSEVLIVGLAVGVGAPLPLLPLQILFLNLVTDVFPALALGATDAGRDVLARSPRPPAEPILGRRQWQAIVIHGGVIAAVTLGSLALATLVLGLEGDAATTMSFNTLALAQLFHVFNMRNWRDTLLTSQVSRNLYVWGAVLLCLAILAGAMLQPQVAGVLSLVPLPAEAWAIVVGLSLVPVVLREAAAGIMRTVRRRSDAEGSLRHP